MEREEGKSQRPKRYCVGGMIGVEATGAGKVERKIRIGGRRTCVVGRGREEEEVYLNVGTLRVVFHPLIYKYLGVRCKKWIE